MLDRLWDPLDFVVEALGGLVKRCEDAAAVWSGRAHRRRIARGRPAPVRKRNRALYRLAAIASDRWRPGREAAERELLALWGATRDPEPVLELAKGRSLPRPLRVAVLELLEAGDESQAECARTLLADDDAEIARRARAVCATAAGPMLDALWESAGARWESPLRDVLLKNPNPPPPGTLDALWDDWLHGPDADGLTEPLLRWGRPATIAASCEPLTVAAVATDPDVLRRPPYRDALVDALSLPSTHSLRPIAMRKIRELGDPGLVDRLCERALTDGGSRRFCRKHRLAPRDEPRRALFFLITGQPEQYRALDPDGGLLSLAYAAASRDERARVREAMLAAGEFDLVRVILGDDRRVRVRDMSADETGYLAEQLAHRRAWDELWSLVLDLPLAAGSRLIGYFDDWAPRDGDARRLFELYRAARPEAVARGLRRLAETGWAERAWWPALRVPGRVNDLSFAPDGPFLAVGGADRTVRVLDVRTGGTVRVHGGFGSAVKRVLHVGDGTVVAGERTNRGQSRCRLVRCAADGEATLHVAPGSITSLALTGADGSHAATTAAGELLLGAPHGGPVEARRLDRFGVDVRHRPRQVVAHPATGRIAVLARDVHVIDPAAGTGSAVRPGDLGVRIAFAGADTVVHADQRGRVARLSLRDGRRGPARRVGTTALDGLAGLRALPHDDRLVVAGRRGPLHVVGAERLEPVDAEILHSRAGATCLAAAPGGEFLAVGHADGEIDLFDLRPRMLSRLVGRSPAEFGPGHLGLVDAALAVPATDGPARQVLGLLRECLHHRFRFDVATGGDVRTMADEHDIGL
ncbi:hypothetical protein AB0L25_38260 [Spirillospora sp. NPDC052242]